MDRGCNRSPGRAAGTAVGAALLPVLLLALAAAPACVEPGQAEQRFDALGDPASVRLHTATRRDTAPIIADVLEAVSEVEGWLDPDDGPLARLNRGATDGFHHFPEEQREFYRCVLLGLDYAQATRGAFDPTVGPLTRLYRESPAAPTAEEIEPLLAAVGWQRVTVATETRAVRFRAPGMELDLGGVIKGFALDLAARAFARGGTYAGLLQIGGNLYAWGAPPGTTSWEVEVPDPRDPQRTLLTVRTTNRGIAVSGRDAGGAPQSGPRRVPVLNATNGRPVAGSLLVAVAIADSGADADALATALMATGYHGAAELLERMYRVEAALLVAGNDGSPQVVASASLRDRVELSPQLQQETGGGVRFQLPPQSIALPL